jgi:hypothetical protein
MYFEAPVVLEGKTSKGDARNRRICVPQKHRASITAPGWVWMRVDAGQPFFAWARRTPSRTSIDITLPSFAVPRLPTGRIVHIEVAPAETSAALELPLQEDWLPHVDREHYFAQGLGDEIALWSGHEPPFFMRRTPLDEKLHWWLLGFYQAEGSKKGAQDFHAANTNPALHAKMITALGTWGIDRSRLRLGLVHRKGTTDAAVRTLLEPLGLSIAFTRATRKNDPCGLLYVNSSLPLVKMVCAKLADVFERGFPSREAALAYAIGWLDGDGSISLDRKTGSINLRLAGTKEEHIVLLQALEYALGWSILAGSFGAVDGYTARALRLDYAAELAVVGAFTESMGRARLIHALAQRLARYSDQGRSLTAPGDALRAQRLFNACLADEARILARHPLAAQDFVTGKKCAQYPR